MIIARHQEVDTNGMTMMETLNLEQAAHLLHLHPVTLQRMAKRGDVPAAKLADGGYSLKLTLLLVCAHNIPRG